MDIAKNSRRKKELLDILSLIEENKAKTLIPLVDEICYLETTLQKLRKFSSIEISDTGKTRITAAGKQYKEYFQSYTNALKVIQSALLKFSVEGEDAFDEWLKKNDLS